MRGPVSLHPFRGSKSKSSLLPSPHPSQLTAENVATAAHPPQPCADRLGAGGAGPIRLSEIPSLLSKSRPVSSREIPLHFEEGLSVRSYPLAPACGSVPGVCGWSRCPA